MSLNLAGYPFGAAMGGSLVALGTGTAIAEPIGSATPGVVAAWVMVPRSTPFS
jgi:hypothetical protein